MPTIFYNKTASKVHPLDFIETALTSAENGNLDEFVFIVSTERLKEKIRKGDNFKAFKINISTFRKIKHSYF